MFVTFARHTIYFSIVIVIPTLLITALTITGILLPVAHHAGGDVVFFFEKHPDLRQYICF